MSNLDILLQAFDQLEKLNPDALSVPRAELLTHASTLSPEDFSVVQPRVEKVVRLFADSAFKRRQYQVMAEYFEALEQTAKRLEAPPASTDGSVFGGRLLPVRLNSESQWLAVIAEAGIDEKTHRAMDANANRNEDVGTVLEIAFRILFLIDPRRAFDWSLDKLRHDPVFEDADVFRDLLMVWNDQADIPAAAAKTVLPLLNRPLNRFFPGTATQLNRLIRLSGLRALAAGGANQGRPWRYLTRVLHERNGAVIDGKLERWLDAAVEQLGNYTANVISAAGRVDDDRLSDEDRKLARRQVFTSVRAVNTLHPAIIVGADIFLKRADGAHTLALAFLGIDRRHLRKWRANLESKAADVVRKLFMEDLRNRRDSAETIRRFCLGDELLYIALYMKLDLFSRQFGSLADREAAVNVLATNYASFRETDLLKEKITRHFRALSRLLHADSIQRLVPEEEVAAVADFANLADALTRASEARRYLEGRRALDTSVEDMCAAEVHFEERLRSARTSLLRGLL
ncbi:MAG: hypothetical protein RRC34_06005 [Lentisphaeria bacterium]|nr:hypothetical protein [Lentisphaeria bacterium]